MGAKMSKNDFSGLGDQIKNIVEDVVDTKNFERLNKDISDTVNSALWEVHNRIQGVGTKPKVQQDKEKQNVAQQYGRNIKENIREKVQSYEKAYKNPGKTYNYSEKENKTAREAVQVYKRNDLLPISKSPAGSVAGILYTVFGAIGMGVMGCVLFGFILGAFVGGMTSLVGPVSLGITLPLLGASILMFLRGGHLRKRTKRFKRYIIQFNGRPYCAIKQLASHMGVSEKYILKDLKKMIRLGMFPQGHIDDQRTCIMLTSDTYDQYLKSQEQLTKREQQVVETKIENEDQQTKDFRDSMEEGKNYIRQIKEVNDAIPEVELSNKLYRLEMVISKIFDYVAQHPDQMPEIRKFMSYYLPTTLKLMNAYKEFDLQSIQGENISTAKLEIRNTLDTINLAFEKLLDSLFQDAAMDVSTDISVLETMLAQEGLTENDFMAK